MAMRLSLLAFLVLGLLTAELHAQRLNPIGKRGPGTTVQLPTFNFFGVSTSVLVPDRGAVMLGGIGGSSRGRTSRGVPLLPGGSSAIGSASGASSVSVHAWIHDLQAMDQAVLAEAARRRGDLAAQRPLRVPLAAPQSGAQALTSVREIKRSAASQDSSRQEEAKRHFEKAQQLEAAGKRGVAKIYYQMALSRARGPFKQEVSTAIKRLSQSPRLAAGK